MGQLGGRTFGLERGRRIKIQPEGFPRPRESGGDDSTYSRCSPERTYSATSFYIGRLALVAILTITGRPTLVEATSCPKISPPLMLHFLVSIPWRPRLALSFLPSLPPMCNSKKQKKKRKKKSPQLPYHRSILVKDLLRTCAGHGSAATPAPRNSLRGL